MKRKKINFKAVNEDKYEIIPWEKIYETNKRIRKAINENNKSDIRK